MILRNIGTTALVLSDLKTVLEVSECLDTANMTSPELVELYGSASLRTFITAGAIAAQKTIRLSDGYDTASTSITRLNGILSLNESNLALTDGTPAYLDSNGHLRSVATVEFCFALQGNSKNVYLNGLWTSSNVTGYLLRRNAYLTDVSVILSSNSNSAITFSVRVNGLTSNYASYVFPSGTQKYAFTGLGVSFNALDEIALYSSSTSNQNDPQVVLSFAWRN